MNINMSNHQENRNRDYTKKIELLCDMVLPLHVLYPKNLKSPCHRDTPMLITAPFTISKIRNDSRYTSTDL